MEKPQDNVIKKDFRDKDVISFLRDIVQDAKKRGVKSAMVMMVDENGHCDWSDWLDNEHDAALMALALEDARQDIKDLVFGEVEEK